MATTQDGKRATPYKRKKKIPAPPPVKDLDIMPPMWLRLCPFPAQEEENGRGRRGLCGEQWERPDFLYPSQPSLLLPRQAVVSLLVEGVEQDTSPFFR